MIISRLNNKLFIEKALPFPSMIKPVERAAEAVLALQEAAEAYLVGLFEASYNDWQSTWFFVSFYGQKISKKCKRSRDFLLLLDYVRFMFDLKI